MTHPLRSMWSNHGVRRASTTASLSTGRTSRRGPLTPSCRHRPPLCPRPGPPMTARLCHDFATSGSRIGHRGALSSTVHARDGGPGTPRNLRPVLTERRIWRGGIGGAPGRSRTCDPRIRSPMLCPAELQAHRTHTVHHATRSRVRASFELVRQPALPPPVPRERRRR
jgi:hypothetical protein